MTEIEYCSDNSGIYIPSDIDCLYNRLVEYNDDEGGKYGVGSIKSILNNISTDIFSRYFVDVNNKLKYKAENTLYVEEWLTAIYNYLKPTESYEIFSTLFKHWAWLVKRKMLGRSVKYHIWINFFGATSLGKTTMIKKICSPMEELLSTTSISKLFDDTKEIKRLTEKYILNFDELAVNNMDGGDGMLASDQLAILKSMLTGDYLDTRVYGTQAQARHKIAFTCVSSANYHLYDIIYDEASMRRFFEFHCEGSKPNNYDEINKWLDNSIEFWKGINEDLSDGYWIPNTNISKQINDIQTKYIPTKTTIGTWLKYNPIEKGNSSAKDIYSVYRNWCDEAGYRNKKSLDKFIEEIKKRYPDFIGQDGLLHLALVVQVSNENISTGDTSYGDFFNKRLAANTNENENEIEF